MASSISESTRRRSIVARIARVLFAAAATLAAAGPALAEAPRSNEPRVRRAARAKLVEGVDALRRGEHRVALERFQEAYALVPSPKIHYDFGLAYVGLGRRAEALSAFERFLAEAQDAPADKRERAARQTTALRPQVGVVEIAVKGAPDGTAIAVDGREVGRAPLARSVYLDPGGHEITVRRSASGAGAVERVEVRAGARLEIVLRVDGAVPGGRRGAGRQRAVCSVIRPASASASANANANAGGGRSGAACRRRLFTGRRRTRRPRRRHAPDRGPVVGRRRRRADRRRRDIRRPRQDARATA